MSPEPVVVFHGRPLEALRALEVLESQGIKTWVVHEAPEEGLAISDAAARQDWGAQVLVERELLNRANRELHEVGIG